MGKWLTQKFALIGKMVNPKVRFNKVSPTRELDYYYVVKQLVQLVQKWNWTNLSYVNLVSPISTISPIGLEDKLVQLVQGLYIITPGQVGLSPTFWIWITPLEEITNTTQK